MKWFTVHGSLRDHPKWKQLTMEQRGAWITLVTIGHGAEPRWRLGPRDHVVRLLVREGATDADALVAGPVAAGLLDDQDGKLRLHDAEGWQRKPSDDPGAVKARVQRHRNAKKRAETPTDRQTYRTGQEALPPDHLNPCPACGADVRRIEGSKGRFYSCTTHPDCSWKSNAPPPDPVPLWTPTPEDLAAIEAQHEEQRRLNHEAIEARQQEQAA